MIRFSKYIRLYIIISAVFILPGLFVLTRWGLKPSIDFSGGTLAEISAASGISQETVRSMAEKAEIPLSSIVKSGGNSFILRSGAVEGGKFSRAVVLLNSEASAGATLVREESVGPVLGSELLVKAVIAAVIAVIAILMYIAYAFRNVSFGVAAVIALIHDLLVVLGSFALFGRFFGVEVDTLFVTAFLTTMSFSVHDTIVVFDRIREYRKKFPGMQFEEICDKALTETIGRSLSNSFTIIFMLVALVLYGGTSTFWFSVALLIGTVSGTYSSDFVATPALIMWNRRKAKS
ncbi:protein-export membrane protein SecF [Candidatus Gottesmanbacteria bacterium RBG_16_52_11]|uniref:Protein-export membrane protein SecF n=1 Tax=Candidatus Gottesmanbacteria bacterium RBG_16_52_11 TaxID=1798374 RepID=A0A1F5YY22_9BACT|nr:MAG: protein-export membrane protein SecF [Candidatus Gottesmanbacteria bacterium RBG_16_52_11]